MATTTTTIATQPGSMTLIVALERIAPTAGQLTINGETRAYQSGEPYELQIIAGPLGSNLTKASPIGATVTLP